MSQPHPPAVSQPQPQPQTTTSTPADASTSASAQHAPATTPTTFPFTSPTDTIPQTSNEKLNAADRYWKFKMAGYTLCIIMGLIGVGCFGWVTSTSLGFNSNFNYGYDSPWAVPWPLITFGISVVWSAIVVAVTLLRKRPVHPGLRVSVDLLLWICYIPTILCALAVLYDTLRWGRYGVIDSFYSYSGDGVYELSNNGTWIWDASGSSSSPPTRDCARSSTSSSRYYSDSPFPSCAEQDAYVNKLWQDKPHRLDVVLTGVVCQFFGLVLHFALFVWACVDTHRHRRTRVGKDAEKIAAGIVEKMVSSGAVVRPPGQTYAQPQQYHYPQQGYQAPQGQGPMYPQMQPQMHPQMQHQGQMHPAPPAAAVAAAGPSSGKGFGPRYA